jgi:hypothetical protein
VDYAWGNVNHRALADWVLLAVKKNRALSFEHIIEFGAELVIMRRAAVDVDHVRPSRDPFVFPADQAITPTTGAAFPGSFVFVTDE